MIQTRDMIILAVIAIVSLVLALRVQTVAVQSTMSKVVTLVPENAVQFDNIRLITLKRGDQAFTFENSDGVWNQVTPFALAIDSASMLAIIESVQGLQVLGVIQNNASLEVLGLGAGANSIELSDGDNAVKVFLGRKTLGGRAYAKIDGQSPLLVSQSLHRRVIDMDYRMWRDVRLFPNFAIDGAGIERDVDGDRLLLERKDGRWEMKEPVSARVDQGMLAEWVGKLAAARVGRYVLDEPADLSMFGLDIPAATFTVTNRNGEDLSVWIGGRVAAGSQDRYVMVVGNPVVFRMSMEALAQLFPVPEMFVDSTGSGVSRFDVKQVVIRTGNKEVKMTREIDRWVDANGMLADTPAIESLLAWVLETKPLSVAISAYPSGDEVASVTLIGYDLAPLDTVRIALDASNQWILENGDNVLRLHPTEAGNVLEPFQN
ncbi:MAG: DUF4340 domain-containing protein [Planctomycetes bacterium]|nr:DUF4340 domain-containing protein [Planctomycetota bacterium]